jgi:hypothetical protein
LSNQKGYLKTSKGHLGAYLGYGLFKIRTIIKAYSIKGYTRVTRVSHKGYLGTYLN